MSTLERGSGPYRTGDLKDVEYKTPPEPWHESTRWFIAAACLNVCAFAAGDIAAWLEHHPIMAANATILCLITGLGTVISFVVAAVKRWG